MNSNLMIEKVREQIEENRNGLPKILGRTIRELRSVKGYTDNDILLHLGKMFRSTLTIACLCVSIVTIYRLYVYAHAFLFADRSMASMNTHMSTDLFVYLIFMIPAVLYVINAFYIYNAIIIYHHILDLQKIAEVGNQ